ncbi:hypothetical protein Mmc1_0153 [Magnetococcus marinus MC-1]|uniref:Uncharacterized protein n=1 Tax=Magnetococcus marinus (strain ATCC BAA-1437 / JCM 17883 / MC-1) TaxID=156889 RepID=A0L3Y7_MAGMM|nr:hypothetical protein [Magnetococcus marinus]ABK42680.1 hypothetical protein Mmc1_0153 [Magnetococcus marinus MC-1]
MANRVKRVEWINAEEADLFQYEDYLDAIMRPSERSLISGSQLPDMLQGCEVLLRQAPCSTNRKSPFSTD